MKIKKKNKNNSWSNRRSLSVAFLILIPLGIITYAMWQSSELQDDTELPLLYNVVNTDFSEFRGRIVVIDCFATWCSPCKAEIPHLADIVKSYDDTKVVVISVGSFGDSEKALRQYKKDQVMSWLVGRDTIGVFAKYDVEYIPTIVILDQNGNIHYRSVGLTEAYILRSEIDELLTPEK